MALRIFYLRNAEKVLRERRRRTRVVALLALLSLWFSIGETGDGDMKRRQQGILTGMPFMANVAARTFVDDLGRTLYLAEPPRRVVSLAPSVTEMLFALELDDAIVGVTEYCNYPPQALTKPKVSYAIPNLEVLVDLHPDLVIVPKDYLRPDTLQKLEQIRVPVFVVDAASLDDIPAQIQTLGRLFKRSPLADAVATTIRQRIAGVKAATKGASRPRLLYVLSGDPLMTVGPGSFIQQAIEAAGGANVAAQTSVAYPRLSLESVLQADPEIIVFPVGASEGIPEDQQRQWLRWTTMTAVKQRRLHQIPADLLHRPGPRIAEGLEALARILHPDRFPQTGTPR
jgi:iron complex transport system substrate-binding protein